MRNNKKKAAGQKGDAILGKIIAITNQKGGVGKTTTAVNLSAAIGMRGYKTLLVDIDPQGNSSSGVGVDRRKLKNTAYEVLIGKANANDVILHTEFKNLDLLPSSMDLAGAEIELVDMPQRESRLRTALAPISANYGFIFIDCPPSLGLITTNALTAADTLLVPIQCEYYALEGLSQLMNSVRRVKRQYNERLTMEGVLLTMFDGRLNLTQQVVEEVKRCFPRKVFGTTIPRTVRLSEAPSFGKPIQYYDKSSHGAQAYEQLALELLRRNGRKG
jgi:chromosome partitioning protein